MKVFKKEEEEKIRLNLVISPKVKEQIDHIQEVSDAASFTEVLRRALAVYSLLMEHKIEGGSICLKHPDGTEEKLVII